MWMQFRLKRPCPKCPFRTDVKPYLSSERAEEILDSICDQQQSFSCHETTQFDDEGECERSDKEQHCAGALILLERMESPNQIMRIAERLGMYDRKNLHMDASVYDDANAMLEAYERGNVDG